MILFLHLVLITQQIVLLAVMVGFTVWFYFKKEWFLLSFSGAMASFFTWAAMTLLTRTIS